MYTLPLSVCPRPSRPLATCKAKNLGFKSLQKGLCNLLDYIKHPKLEDLMGRKDKQRRKLRKFIEMQERQRLKNTQQCDPASISAVERPLEPSPVASRESSSNASAESMADISQDSSVKTPVEAAAEAAAEAAVEAPVEAPVEVPPVTSKMAESAPDVTNTTVTKDEDSVQKDDRFLRPIRKEILQDPETELPGFVAGLLEELEEEYVETRRASQNYGSIVSKHPNVAEIQGLSQNQLLDAKPVVQEMSSARLKAIMSSLYLGIFLAAIDNTIVSTVSPHIASEFKEFNKISWVATAYLLSSAAFQPLYGKVSDIFGRKPLLIFTNIAFLIGCLICGLSKSLWWLVLGRFISGIGGGGMTSISSITITDIVPLRERALYQGICNFFFGLGTGCGGIIGGWFSDSFGGWRMAFLVQVPLSAISTFMIVMFLELPKKNGKEHPNSKALNIKSKLMAIDWSGAITLITFLGLFLITASLGGKEIPFDSNIFLIMCLLSVLSFVIFVFIELRVASDPILPLSFLKDRSVLGSSLSNWFCMMSIMTTSYYLPVYFSGVLNMKPTAIGKRIAPNFFSTSLGSLGAGYYMKKTGKYYWFVILFCVSVVLGQLQIYLMKPDIATWRQYTLTMIPGFGTSVLITVALLAMIAAVPHEHQAATTSISYAFRSVGCTLGVSFGGAIFRESLSDYLNKDVMQFLSKDHPKKKLMKYIQKASSSSEWVHDSAPEFLRPTLINCYHEACKNTFLFCLICSVATLLSISIIKEKKLHSSLNRNESGNEEETSHLLADA